MLRAAIYARVSSEEQAGKGRRGRALTERQERDETKVSLDQQIAACRQYAIQRGYQVVLIKEDIQTGLDPSRPNYRQILEAARRGEVDVALVWKWDRWGRDAGESIRSYQELRQLGVRVESVMEPGDDPLVQGFFALMGWAGSRDTSQRVRASMRVRAERGDWVAGNAPLGYQVVRHNDRPTLEPDPLTAPLLRALFEDAATGRYSLAQLLERCYERGLWSRSDKPRGIQYVSKILHNPAYRGAVVYGRNSRSRFRARGGQPVEDWITVEGAHPALVSQETWDAVQRWLSEHRRYQGTVRGTVYLLTSLLTCERCGRRLYGQPDRRKAFRPVSYYCQGRMQYGICKLPGIYGPTLESLIKQETAATFAMTADVRTAAAAKLEHEAREQGGQLEERRRQLTRKRAEHEQNRLTLARRLMGNVIAEDVYRQLEAAEVQAIQVLDRALTALPPAPPVVDLRARLAALAEIDWDALDRDDWREVLIALAERIVVAGPREYRIVWRPEAEFVRRVVANVSTTHPHQ